MKKISNPDNTVNLFPSKTLAAKYIFPENYKSGMSNIGRAIKLNKTYKNYKWKYVA